jgi:hypothetical protein
MSEINIAYMEFRLSGGTANTAPGSSLGGQRSSERIFSQSTSALSNITGVEIEYAAGNALGNGTLAFDIDLVTLRWTPNGGTAGTVVDISAGGKFTIKGGGDNGLLLVDVVASNLPVGDESDTVTIANIANELWDDVSKAESFAGDTEYRCLYIYNTHDVDAFLDTIAYITAQPTPEATIAIGLDPITVGTGLVHSVVGITRSGSTATAEITGHPFVTGETLVFAGADQAAYNVTATVTYVDADHVSYTVSGTPTTPATGTITASSGVAQTVANESTAPSGVTFTSPSSSGSGISFGEIAIGKCRALWVRRVVATRNTTSNAASINVIALQAYF